MKNIKLLSLLATFAIMILSKNALGAESFVRFSIDKSLFETMDSTQQGALVSKSQEILNFINGNLLKKIPTDVQEKIKDLKIKVYLTDVPGRDGLFIPQESGEHTISIQLIQMHSNGINALLAHEIFHAIHFHLNPDELPWMREGMAQLFEFITTGELNGMNLYAAIHNPMTPLLGEYSPEEKNPAQYGHNQLYFYYLYNHCGGDKLFWKITKGDNENGEKGSFLIDRALKEMDLSNVECQDFSESAIIFEVAKAHNQMSFGSILERTKYFLYPGDISPKFKKVKNTEEFKNLIKEMPVLSSFKLSMEDYMSFGMTYPNLAVFYANNSFPYNVVELPPAKAKGISVILVKLRR